MVTARDIQRIGVVGCGLMGSGIVEFARGLDVTAVELTEGALEAGHGRVESSLGRAVNTGKLTREEEGSQSLERTRSRPNMRLLRTASSWSRP